MLALQRKLNKQVAMTVEWKQKHDVLHSHPTGAPRIRELEEQLHDKDVELVAAGNKNFQLHDASVKAKEQRTLARKELAAAREILVRGVAGDAAEVERYRHVPFPELIRLRLLKEDVDVSGQNRYFGATPDADLILKMDPETVAMTRHDFSTPEGQMSPQAAKRTAQLERQREAQQRQNTATSLKKKSAAKAPRRNSHMVLQGAAEDRASHGTCKKCKHENLDLSHSSWKKGPHGGKGDPMFTTQKRHFGYCSHCFATEVAETGGHARRTTPASFPASRKKTGNSVSDDRDALLSWLQRELRRRRIGSSRLMGLMDDNRSASASFNEFTNGLAAVDIDLERADYMRLFKAVDVGGDLSVTVAELKQRLYTAKYGSEKAAAAVKKMESDRPSSADLAALSYDQKNDATAGDTFDLSASTSSLPPLSVTVGGGGGGGGPEGRVPADWEVQQMRAVEQEIKDLKNRNWQLQNVLNAERRRTDSKLDALSDMDTLQAKHGNSMARLRNEKETVRRLEDEVNRGSDRITALSEHIEKLMVHLKHEAAAKAKASDQLRRSNQDLQLQKNRNVVLAKKVKARDKVIRQLREGCKILEDQLRLMDTKYIDLRQKLDWTRTHAQKEVRRIQTEANKLRAKWMMAAGTEATLAALGIDDEAHHDNTGGPEHDRTLMSTAGTGRSSKGGHGDPGGNRPGTSSTPDGGFRLRPNTGGATGTQSMPQFRANQMSKAPLDSTDEPWGDSKLESLQNWATDERG